MDARLVVLGAGQDGGSPQFGRTGGEGPPRTASSVAVVDGDTVVILDASPDIRWQYRTLVGHIGGRDPYHPIDALGITHVHMGHYAGIVHFGEEAASVRSVPLIAPPTVITFLSDNDPWRAVLDGGHLLATPILDEPVTVGRIALTAIEVPHRGEHSTTVAYSIGIDGTPWALYLPDIDSWAAWSAAEATIANHAVALLDATFGDPAELPGRDLGAIPHPIVTDTISRFEHLARDRRIILTHINHSNLLADDTSPLAAMARDAGFVIAHDGLMIPFEGTT
jgi:pyrroloquinoline quinone biosynthesis protein B